MTVGRPVTYFGLIRDLLPTDLYPHIVDDCKFMVETLKMLFLALETTFAQFAKVHGD